MKKPRQGPSLGLVGVIAGGAAGVQSGMGGLKIQNEVFEWSLSGC